MKKLFALTLILCFIHNLSAAPLIYKNTRAVTLSETLTQIGIFDASQYKQIRIGVSRTGVSPTTVFQWIQIEGVEAEATYLILTSSDIFTSQTFVLDTPPAQIKVCIRGSALYQLHVWGAK